ncbi:EAL domain-containing response regulator [Ramlibacter humi]|uniref:EAL domain-containing protein n=1 Tax=Ramlibacter humi TaxID=2530451 RepID=A0A4Z0C7R4_9BURK|nr:EAL domain-containing response regulator [Ramlibacter humi]TFZ07716.1 EAL domain-containing protein [Ramlibacter humi]
MPCRNLRFLVVEDHEFQRLALTRLLQTLGAATVREAGDGRAALQVLRDPDRPVDIVLTDLSMPAMDGMEFIRHLSEAGSPVSVILTSALEPALLASIAHMARTYKVRLLGVIAKPVAAAKLVPLVELHRGMADEQVPPEVAFPLDEIAEAWTRNEFELWYEPQVLLASGTVRAMHAGARWDHPGRGILEPAAFMPSVQARGLKEDFGWLVLQKAVAQCRLWQAEGRDLSVWVRLDFDSLADVNTAARIRQTTDNEGLSPGHLVLGIPEAALQADQARVLENLARLRMHGFGLAIEDFGHGAMDVDRLALVAFTALKFDRGFVTGVDRDSAARAGLAVGLELARKQQLATVATGIGTKDEWQLLHDWGCLLAQGPFIAAPMPAAAVPAWTTRWTRSTIR